MSEITIIFQEKLGSKNTPIKVNSNTKFSELIRIYYKKECISKKAQEKLKFVFMNKEISSSSEKKVRISFSALNKIKIKEKEKLEKFKQKISKMKKNETKK